MGFYETQEEAQMRLHGTVFLFNGEPVICDLVVGNGPDNMVVHVTELPQRVTRTEVPMKDPRLQFRQFPLGYVNTKKGALYLKRMPVRRFKQGLSRESVMVSGIGEDFERANFDQVSRTMEFKNMIHGVYPSLQEAIKLLDSEDRPTCVAFHRRFAVGRDKFRKDNLMYYRGKRVGYGTDSFVLPEEFAFLKEVSQQIGLNLRHG